VIFIGKGGVEIIEADWLMQSTHQPISFRLVLVKNHAGIRWEQISWYLKMKVRLKQADADWLKSGTRWLVDALLHQSISFGLFQRHLYLSTPQYLFSRLILSLILEVLDENVRILQQPFSRLPQIEINPILKPFQVCTLC